jgi:poly-gamma-glutamate synthesis protein (capsule biosynthesis protein)
MKGLTYAGFNVITLTGNHMWDAGVPGIEDTIAWLKEHNIAPVGSGVNIDEARRPARSTYGRCGRHKRITKYI